MRRARFYDTVGTSYWHSGLQTLNIKEERKSANTNKMPSLIPGIPRTSWQRVETLYYFTARSRTFALQTPTPPTTERPTKKSPGDVKENQST